MDAFETALEFVHESLAAMRDRGVQAGASIASLAQLSAASRHSSPALQAAEPAATAPRVATTVIGAIAVVPATPAPVAPMVAKLPFDPLPSAPPAVTGAGRKAERLQAMRGPVLACTKCPVLARTRTQVVFGVGNPEAELMFVGEAPGADEDRRGEPFVGLAGQLLTKIIETMGFSRAGVYIANVLKCRPDMPPNSSGNRKPTPDEMRTCLPYLEEQIAIIQPRVLVALGATAMQGLLGEVSPMNQLRGRWHKFREIPLMATYHPAYLLRNQSMGEKRKVWEDMLLVLTKLGRPISEKQRGFFLQKG